MLKHRWLLKILSCIFAAFLAHSVLKYPDALSWKRSRTSPSQRQLNAVFKKRYCRIQYSNGHAGITVFKCHTVEQKIPVRFPEGNTFCQQQKMLNKNAKWQALIRAHYICGLYVGFDCSKSLSIYGVNWAFCYTWRETIPQCIYKYKDNNMAIEVFQAVLFNSIHMSFCLHLT